MTLSATQKPFVVPIFIPHAGCPHRCVFCDQTRTTSLPDSLPATDQVENAIRRFLSYRKNPDRQTEISFYGGNFLGLHRDSIVCLLETAARFVTSGEAHGIRFSTRPDTIDEDRISLLSEFPVTTIELGVQSMNDHVLTTARRGHTAQAVHEAVALLKGKPYRLGLQMMVGLPGDTPDIAMATGKEIAALRPDFVRIYATLVLKGSALARWYRQGRYSPLELESAVASVKALYAMFTRYSIQVIRMGLQATDGLNTGMDMVAGPFHPAFGDLVHAALWLDAMRRGIETLPSLEKTLQIVLNPGLISRVRGQHSRNMAILKREYALDRIDLSADTDLAPDRILLNGSTCHLIK